MVESPAPLEHRECDCVPDLGPTHCHACSEEAGYPVTWAESHGCNTCGGAGVVGAPPDGYMNCPECVGGDDPDDRLDDREQTSL